MIDRDRFGRRRVLGAISAGVTVGTAGCIGGTTEDGADDDHGDEGDESDVDEETRELAAEMVAAVDDELSVIDWEIPGMFIPEYTDSGGLEEDVPILGDAYADIVDQGFDRRAMPTALEDDEESVDFMVFLEPEWATAYLEGEWSGEEYYAEIEDSEH